MVHCDRDIVVDTKITYCGDNSYRDYVTLKVYDSDCIKKKWHIIFWYSQKKRVTKLGFWPKYKVLWKV